VLLVQNRGTEPLHFLLGAGVPSIDKIYKLFGHRGVVALASRKEAREAMRRYERNGDLFGLPEGETDLSILLNASSMSQRHVTGIYCLPYICVFWASCLMLLSSGLTCLGLAELVRQIEEDLAAPRSEEEFSDASEGTFEDESLSALAGVGAQHQQVAYGDQLAPCAAAHGSIQRPRPVTLASYMRLSCRCSVNAPPTWYSRMAASRCSSAVAGAEWRKRRSHVSAPCTHAAHTRHPGSCAQRRKYAVCDATGCRPRRAFRFGGASLFCSRAGSATGTADAPSS